MFYFLLGLIAWVRAGHSLMFGLGGGVPHKSVSKEVKNTCQLFIRHSMSRDGGGGGGGECTIMA